MRSQINRFRKADQTAKEAAKLKGPVARVMTISYQPKLQGNMVLEGPLIEDRSVYDDLNHILTFNPDGNLAHELLYGSPGEWTEKTYEADNRVLDIREFSAGKLVKTNTHTYNANGKLIRYRSVLADGTPQLEATYQYNKKGQRVKHDHENYQHPEFSKTTVYTYDDEGRGLGNESRLKLTGALDMRCTKTYDEKGRLKETITENPSSTSDVLNHRDVFFYNEYDDQVGVDKYDLKGNLIKSLRYGDHYQYDAQGKRIPQVHEEENRYTFQDKEDEHGNWTWRLVLEADEPRLVMVRQIQYEGEAKQEWVHPLQEAKEQPEVEEHRRVNHKDRQPMSDEDVRFVYSQPGLTPDQFPLIRYYTASFKYPPSLTTFSGNIEAGAILRYCMEHFGARKVFQYRTSSYGYRQNVRYALEFGTYPGYLLYANHISQLDADSFIVPDKVSIYHDELLEIGSFQFLCPPDNSELKNGYFEEMVENMMIDLTVKKRPDKPKISLIEVHNGNFALVERAVHDNFTIRNLDVNYGQGFEQFHNDLMRRFNSSKKGLVLFHGVPGTGKTYYIRHLLRQMAVARKSVIYMPPNMVDHLTDPTFMTFLTNSVQHLSQEGNFCVLLIEDAEPLLAKRQEGVRIQGVTNLLNMTDGLLNDMLNLQIICTFNVDLRKLDSALLRPGRLLARKEFKPLSVLDANLLAQRLGINKHFTKPASLGQIYAMMHDQNTLVHDVDPNKDTSSPIDDLI
ncbi:MAG: AAA family ATPase [Flavobacteriales bacterium]|nr:AAA family ATPase [Flavobacteriales bacterium]MCB9192491.1 AAA family ATPase [Flavobacteriales bacterium]